MTAPLVPDAVVSRAPFDAQGEIVDIGGERYFKITNSNAMAPFLMSLVSGSDQWMFASSTGALTAGRRDADNALFPYYTDDKIHDSAELTGGKTIIRVTMGERTGLWEPLSSRFDGPYRVVRSLYKSVYGNKLILEEINHDLGLAYTSSWMMSDRFGFVRRASLCNLAHDPVVVCVLDGIQNILPTGLTQRFQLEYSTLADGYKESELHRPSGLGLFRLSSIPADQPRPREALRATTVWCEGLIAEKHLLCAAQLDRFRHGEVLEDEFLVRGRRGAYFVQSTLTLASRQKQEWSMVADVSLDAARVAETVALIGSGADVREQIDRDIAVGTEDLTRIVGGADGLQKTRDERNAWRHYSNTLFNVMRGGIPDCGYQIPRDDFAAFVTAVSRPLAQKYGEFLASLPPAIHRDRLLEQVRRLGDADLERLASEYMPLTFSRRHGDPSRPWNIFTIDVKGPHGERVLNYQGNWRDIFQNWEALAHSFPGFIESMIFKFLDASTADGYNPYRITRDGFDWEVLDPHDAWSYIGYWGDHQVAYLLKLLETAAKFSPRALTDLLRRRVFTFANVPYRIKSYEEILKDPHATIDFDVALDRAIRARAAEIGSDGKVLFDGDGAPYRVDLAEKLIIVILARLFNFVPGAGLWMNTQRPEWNDANNALVGNGVSMVTLCYLRRFLAFTRTVFDTAGTSSVEVSTAVATAFDRVRAALQANAGLLDGAIDDANRRSILDELGRAGSDYRAEIYAQGLSGAAPLPVPALIDLCDLAIRYIDHSIRANKREDGLYHAYNILEFREDGIAVRRLQEMLEGQVAVLSSGALQPVEAADLLDALRKSKLYRQDQNSYLLYPDKTLPGFFDKNNIPAASLAGCPTLVAMIAKDDKRVVIQDVNGVAHFNASFYNVSVLEQALAPLDISADEQARILALYEDVFHHQSFTGRSGSFYKYEGLGCIYWHMVSKLLLSVQEMMWQTTDAGELERLRQRYLDIRDGLGVHKSPANYGAVPLDPYSHTPGFAGVQQPGMTGQVKEDIISRIGEMGASFKDGYLSFSAAMIKRDEFLREPARFDYFDVDGMPQSLDLQPGSLAFTICQVPVVIHEGGDHEIEIAAADGFRRVHAGLRLDAETSRAIFQRSGVVRRLDVMIGQ
jgi:hypothetical protein